MSIHFLSGKPGGGKSTLATKKIIELMRETDKHVATNVSLNLDRIAEYLLEKHGESFDVKERIRILDSEQAAEFWLHPYLNVDLDPELRVFIHKRGKVPLKHIDFATQRVPLGLPGVVYVIDEIHEFFNSREWQTTGTDCLHYLSQHRKFGDTVFAISQSIENVEKVFTRLAQDFTTCRNLSKMKMPILGGIFNMPNMFVTQTFLAPPGPMTKAVETRTFTLDVKGICSCFDTAAGVGVGGLNADKEHKKSGLPWYIFPAGAVALGVGFLWLCFGFLPTIGKTAVGMFPGMKPTAQTNQVAQVKSNLVQAKTVATSVASMEIKNDQPPLPHRDTNGVWASGVIKMPGKPMVVYLSDGSKYSAASIQSLTANDVRIGGVTYPRSEPHKKGVR